MSKRKHLIIFAKNIYPVMISYDDFRAYLGLCPQQRQAINVTLLNRAQLEKVNFKPSYFKFFSFISIESGQADYVVNSRHYPTQAGDVLATSPRLLVGIENISHDFSAIYVTADIDLVEKTFTDVASCKVIADWFITNRLPLVEANDGNTATVAKTMRLMLDIDQSHLNCKEEIKSHLLQVAAMNLSDILSIHNNHGAVSHQETIYRNFIALVSKNYHTTHSTKFYADALGITPVYLARIVRRFAVKTVKEFIHGLLYRDALDLLNYSDMQITEIAYALGFPDIETFSKFFKRKNGQAPSQIRKSGTPQDRILKSNTIK